MLTYPIYTEPFTYRPWEYTSIDVDEEDEDAEADAEEEEMEEEEVRHQVFVFIILALSANYRSKLAQVEPVCTMPSSSKSKVEVMPLRQRLQQYFDLLLWSKGKPLEQKKICG